VWSVAVALSTILIIASVGYAQKRPVSRQATSDATASNGDAPRRATDAGQTISREEFVTAWRANGHHSIAVLAEELGVNVRTAQRWVKADEAAQAGNSTTEGR
jgi:hypothetical protein